MLNHRVYFRHRHSWFGLALVGLLGLATARPVAADPAADLARARDLQAHERWAASESLATAARVQLEAARNPDSLALADALHLVAVARWMTVGYADTTGSRAAWRSLAIRERRLGPKHLTVAEAHQLVGRFLAGTAKSDSALIHVRRALDIRRALLAPDDTLIAQTWDHLALVHRDRRDMRGALDAWNEAIAIYERRDGHDSPEVARLLGQTGVPYMELGQVDRARQALEEALGIFARTTGPDDPRRWIPLNILADLEGRAANYAADLDLLREALRIVRASYGDDSREALTLNSNIALALQSFGDHAGAYAMFAPLLPRVVAQYGPEHPRVLHLRHGLALVSRAVGDTAAAMKLFAENAAILSKRPGPHSRQLTSALGEQAALFFRQGRDAEALAMLRKVIQLERSAARPDPTVLADMQGALVRDLSIMSDSTGLARAVDELAEIENRYGIAGTQQALWVPLNAAFGLRRLGRDREAWDAAIEAERLAREGLRVNLQALADRRALQLGARQESPLEFLIDFATASGDAARLETAWDRLVRTRGLVRAEVARRRPSRAAAADSGLAGAHARWMAAQRRLAQRLVRSGAPRDSASRATHEALRAAAETAEAAYARQLATRGGGVPPLEVGLADVRVRLGPRQALVGFYCSRRTTGRWLNSVALRDTNDLYAFVVRGDGGAVRSVSLGTSIELEDAIAPWRERLAVSPGPAAKPGSSAEAELRRLGRRARAATWDRIAPLVAGATDVYLVGDGSVLDLPWQALPDGARGYLVEAGPRLHLLNAERELAEPERERAPAAQSLLAFGGPDYENGVATAGAPALAALVRAAPDPCSEARLRTLAPLPGASAEAEAVARVWGAGGGREAIVRTGAGASEAAFKREAAGHAVLHLATHGVVAGDTCASARPGTRGVGGVDWLASAGAGGASRTAAKRARVPAAAASAPAVPTPWLSRRVWLALAGANHAAEYRADENEGFLTAEEVLTMDLDGTDWVVLSACHSGLAEAWSREGTLGMRRAFDLAGARSVIASQWAVEDDATREWMTALYEARATGATTAAAAIASASRSVLAARRKAGRSTHPFYWAAFSASGE